MQTAYCCRKCQFEAWSEHQFVCYPPAPAPLDSVFPASVLGKIASHLSDNMRDLMNFRRVAKAFDAALSLAEVNLNLDHYRYGTPCSQSHPPSNASAHVMGRVHGVDRGLNALAQVNVVCRFANARHVILHNRYRDVADRHIAAVACHCPQLRTLVRCFAALLLLLLLVMTVMVAGWLA